MAETASISWRRNRSLSATPQESKQAAFAPLGSAAQRGRARDGRIEIETA